MHSRRAPLSFSPLLATALALACGGCGGDTNTPGVDAGDGGGVDAGGGMTDTGGGTTDSGGVDAGGGGTDAGPITTSQSVVTHHNGRTRDGVYVAPTFTRAAAATMGVDPGFTATIAGPTYAHPLYYDAPTGSADLLIVATEQNDVYALDAADGHQVWMVNLGAPAPLSSLPCGNIDPLGITGTPYLDVAARNIYLDTMRLVSGAPRHFIHALSLDDGSERSGWPVDVDASVSYMGLNFDSSVQNQRGALLLLGDTVYVPYGGHWGDCGSYHGWLVGVPVADPAHPHAWATRAEGAGSWAPGGVASDGTDLFVSTGNGFGASTWSDQEAIIRLHPGPTFSMATTDYWAPTNWLALDAGDVDLGGSGPVLLEVPAASPSALAVALGKDGNVYLIDRANMGGVGAPIDSLRVSGSPIITAASAYAQGDGANVTFQASGTGCPGGSADLVTVHVSGASPPALSLAWCAREGGHGSPIVTTTDGTAESIVWTIGSETSNQLRAFDGDTGAVIFDGTGTAVGSFRRFVSPIVANGRIYAAGAAGVYAFRPM